MFKYQTLVLQIYISDVIFMQNIFKKKEIHKKIF